jgi:CHAT domain-containing protein
LWKVEDEATADLMKAFYANILQKGRSPAAALREAQISLMRTERWRSPFYWAAFQIQGNW